MAKLIFLTNTSLDGYIEDAAGNFDWSTSAQMYNFYTESLRGMGTLLYGRRLYEKMAYWGSPLESYPPEHRAFAEVWQRPQKWIYSRTLSNVSLPNTRILRELDREEIKTLKRISPQAIGIGGAELASVAFESGLIDEYHVVVHPVVVGGGKSALQTPARRDFRLLESRPFDTGAIFLRYQVLESPA